MGTPRLLLCGGSSTEQILQTVHSPPALSLLQHIVCARAFHSGWGEDCSQSHWANTGERSLPSLLCSQENLPFLFFYWSSKLSSWAGVWCQKAELIALKQRGGPPITKPPRHVLSEIIKAFSTTQGAQISARRCVQLSFEGLWLKIILVLSFLQRAAGTQETNLQIRHSGGFPSISIGGRLPRRLHLSLFDWFPHVVCNWWGWGAVVIKQLDYRTND